VIQTARRVKQYWVPSANGDYKFMVHNFNPRLAAITQLELASQRVDLASRIFVISWLAR
jgi:hypothetical protein